MIGHECFLPDDVNGDVVLDDIAKFINRFVAFPSEEALTAATLWAAHTHAIDMFDNTPRLALLSPLPASGKTRALEILELLVRNPVLTVNSTAAYLFRRVGAVEGPPTLLFDEIDTVFGVRARENEDVRGLLNAGYRRGATANRCATHGKEIVLEAFSAFSAVALAGLDDLPETIMTRSIVIRMRRRAPHEVIEPFRLRQYREESSLLRDRLAGWVETAKSLIDGVFPELPAGVEDRDADVWEPLITIADAAGGRWADLARVSCVSFVSSSREDTGGGSLGLRLLGDLRVAFESRPTVFTEDLLEQLNASDEDSRFAESGWGEYKGHGLTPAALAQLLGKFGITSRQVRVGRKTKKGYHREDLYDAWLRYLSSPVDETSETAETPEPVQSDGIREEASDALSS